MKLIFCFLFTLLFLNTFAQDTTLHRFKGVFFPYPMDRPAKFSVGLTFTTMPYDITEELHFQIPALDVHLLKRVSKKLALDMRANVQVVQNLLTAGPRWATTLNDRFSISIGNEVGYWFGAVNTEGIRTRGHGFQNVPHLAIGHRFNRRVLLTFRAEALMNFGIKTYAKDTELTSDYRLFGGSTYSLILEQPFYGNKVLTIGLRGIYTDFFWQTWSLFETFDRNIFYPQVIIGLNL
ncbi:MAG: hypothetical protein JWR72_3542 [Flavisolibacter sp.]|nr:hypothetical protein [Flavisolibacter sp.]